MCLDCEEIKPETAEFFYPRGKNSTKFHSLCRLCDKARKRVSYAMLKCERGGEECECGAVKASGDASCQRCLEMDGCGAVGSIVSALRVLGGSATFEALTDEMGIATRNVFRAIAEAKKAGRVVQIHQHDDVNSLADKRRMASVRSMMPDNHPLRMIGKSINGMKFQAPSLFILLDKKVAV